MRAIAERVCGLDVGEKIVVACVLVGPANRKAKKEVRTFGTFTRDLEELRDWLVAEEITHVAMESTGAYWVPIYTVLEAIGRFELVVGNAQHIKNVPGRKTDVKDAEWIADLLRHGLIRKSFVPPKPLRDLRDLLRYRRGLINGRTMERNRLLKLLETAGIKLASVASDAFGKSGMLMLQALARGESNPEDLAALAKGRMRSKVPQLALALRGHLDDHHRFTLQLQLERLEETDRALAKLDAEIDRRLEPYREQHKLLMGIPGVDRVVAAVIIAELGTDMSIFPTVQHAAAWSGVCPGNNESAGKTKRTSSRKGNVHLKTALVQAGVAASRTKGSYFRAKHHRLRARLGGPRAAVAMGHKILICAYHILQTGEPYRDLGEAHLDRVSRTRTVNNLLERLHRLGYDVQLRDRSEAQAAAAMS